MGKFSDRIKSMFSGKPDGLSEEQERLVKKYGKKNLKRFEDMPTAMYAIRLADNHDYFIHPVGETADQLIYVVKKGIIGAAFWQWHQGIEFIKQGKENLEMILVDKKFLESHRDTEFSNTQSGSDQSN